MENKGSNRRGFLKSWVLGATGLVVGQNAFSGTITKSFKTGKEEPKIVTRTLGRTGIKLPIVSMGVMRADNPNLVRAALDKGIKFLDTAHTYQNGRNEEMLGEVLKDYPRGQDRKTGLYNEDEFTQESYMEMFNLSMDRLGLDYVDILYHHGVISLEGMFYEPLVDIMNQIKQSCRARFLGVSTHSNEAAVLEAAAECGFIDVVLTAYNFTMNAEEMNAAIEKAADAGLGIVAIMESPELTEEEKSYIEENKQMASLFCTGCRECLTQCRKNLPIPDFMRAYMYTYGYSNLEKAHGLLTDLDLSNDPCSGCNTCTVACSRKFDVAARIKDVSRLVDVPGEFIMT